MHRWRYAGCRHVIHLRQVPCPGYVRVDVETLPLRLRVRHGSGPWRTIADSGGQRSTSSMATGGHHQDRAAER